MLWPLVVLAAAVCAAADIEVLFFQNTLQRADWKEARRFFFCLFFEYYSNATMCFPCSIAKYIYIVIVVVSFGYGSKILVRW